MTFDNQMTPTQLGPYKQTAEEHLREFHKKEEIAMRAALASIQPPDAPVTIQLYQAHDGGWLVDVGPRPKGAPDAHVSQAVGTGSSGALFKDDNASNRFTPTIDDAPTGRDAFSAEQLALEAVRYQARTASWSNGIPKNTYIAQLPLTSLPASLCPTKSGKSEVLRLPHLGAVYTLSRDRTFKNDAICQSLILHALCAGRIIHNLRLEHVLASDKNPSVPAVNRLKVAKETIWKKSTSSSGEWYSGRPELVDTCVVVGTLMLNHHLFFPFDAVTYKLFSALSSADYANQVYYLHCCCPPTHGLEKTLDSKTNIQEAIDTLTDDILRILELAFCDPHAAITGCREAKRKLIKGAIVTMTVQLLGELCHGAAAESQDGEPLESLSNSADDCWSWIGPLASWKDFKVVIESHDLTYTATHHTKAQARPSPFSKWVLAVLSPGLRTKASGRMNSDRKGNTIHKFTVAEKGTKLTLARDHHHEAIHFLRAHTRATWNVLWNKE